MKNCIKMMIINIITLGIYTDILMLTKRYKDGIYYALILWSLYIYNNTRCKVSAKSMFIAAWILNVISLGWLVNFGIIRSMKQIKEKAES